MSGKTVSPRRNEGVWALLAYCFSSISMTLLNKAVLSSSSGFNMNFLLLAIQAACSVGLLRVCRNLNLAKYRQLKFEEAKEWFPVSLLLISMIYTGSKALQYLTVAMFTVFKNLTIIAVAVGEERFFGSRITQLMWIAFGLMVVGSVVGGFNDLAFNLRGYVWMALNSASSAGYLLYMKRTIKRINFGDFDSAYYSNILSLPVMLVLSLLFEDWRGFLFEKLWHSAFDVHEAFTLVLAMGLSGLAGFFISYTTAWCIRVAPSTTFSMTGALNKLPVTISGLLFFSQERAVVNSGYIASIVISFVAGIVYSFSQIMKKRDDSVEQQKPMSPTTSGHKYEAIGTWNERGGPNSMQELVPMPQPQAK